MLLAKELATLDRLSHGRLLPAFGLGAADPGEHQAFGVERGQRAKIFNEVLPLLRRFWAGETVDHEGDAFQLRGRRRAARSPSRSRSRSGSAASRRPSCGAAAAWATAGCRRSAPPRTCGTGIAAIQAHAAEAGREIDPEHFGALIPYTDGPIPEVVAAGIAQRRPGVEPEPR